MTPSHRGRDFYTRGNLLAIIRRIYKNRIQLILLLLLICTILLYVLDYAISEKWLPFLTDLGAVPVKAIADACLTTLLVGFAYEWVVRNEADASLQQTLSESLERFQGNLLQKIPGAIVLDRTSLRSILEPSRQIDALMKECLSFKIGDPEMAEEVYASLLDKTVKYSHAMRNYRFKATLSTVKHDQFKPEIRNKYYDTTIDLRYDIKLEKSEFLFRCVSTPDQYNRAIADARNEFTWLFPNAKPDFKKMDSDVLDVERFSINDIDCNIRRMNERDGEAVISCSHPRIMDLREQEVTISYRYSVKLNKRGHLLMVTPPLPTKNVVIELDFADSDIYRVNVRDFFFAANLPRINYVPSEDKARKIEVELADWSFPKGGVIFVWTLKNEMVPGFLVHKLPATKRKSNRRTK